MRIHFDLKFLRSFFFQVLALFLTIYLIPSYSFAISNNPAPICSAGTCTISFSYTGDFYAWTVPYEGSYTLEVWGAQGGNGVPYSSAFSSTGGKGGYAKGNYLASTGTIFNIYVGGTAGAGTSSGTSVGGWNGGGTASTMGMAGGGGASDIRVNGTANSNRIIVAGGGGGGGNANSSTELSDGGPGGGEQAPTMATNTQFSLRTPGSGGTQSTGYALGVGSPSSGVNLRGAGGGGYWGGGVGGNSTGGGGGSGYVGGVTNSTNIAGNLSMPNPAGGNMIGRSGNGFVRISYSEQVADTTAPTFTSSSSFSVAENISISATAATIKVSESATVTISAGADASLFNIYFSDSVTAIIKFKTSPDYEAPADVGANNIYEITLTATDAASNAGTQSITITVTNVVDTSSFNSFALAGGVTTATFRGAIQINASVTVASRITFRAANMVIPGCKSIFASGSGSTFTVSCSWKPSKRGSVILSASSVPINNAISGASASPINVSVMNRTGPR